MLNIRTSRHIPTSQMLPSFRATTLRSLPQQQQYDKARRALAYTKMQTRQTQVLKPALV
jgi:hypothetical protein